MSEKEKRVIPVFTDGDGVVLLVAMTVEVDAAGEYWLDPEQTEQLHATAERARAAWATTASDRLELG